jgi:hypothetical protein
MHVCLFQFNVACTRTDLHKNPISLRDIRAGTVAYAAGYRRPGPQFISNACMHAVLRWKTCMHVVICMERSPARMQINDAIIAG